MIFRPDSQISSTSAATTRDQSGPVGRCEVCGNVTEVHWCPSCQANICDGCKWRIAARGRAAVRRWFE